MSESFSNPSSGHSSSQQRTALVGRVKMAKAMEMSEPDWAKALSTLEKDPLFLELTRPADGNPIVRYKRFGHSRLADGFYDAPSPIHEVSEAEMFEKRRQLLEMASRMGHDAFERAVVLHEGTMTPDVIVADDLLSAVSTSIDKIHHSSLSDTEPVNVLGKVAAIESGAFAVSFYFPHLVRGLFEIDRPRLKEWQSGRGLGKEDASRLRRLVGLMELSNMKQGAFWRVLERLMVLNRDYFETRDPSRMAPVSLRKLADQLDFAPSTVSRVVSGKSLILPWGQEAAISDLMPGQRRVVLSILEKVLPDMPRATDLAIARRLKESHGVTVSRRTVTACRHIIEGSAPQANAA